MDFNALKKMSLKILLYALIILQNLKNCFFFFTNYLMLNKAITQKSI